MTIAVCAPWPWGRLFGVFPPGIDFEEKAVILAADTRFSNEVRTLDNGRKIYLVAPNMALVYSGRVWTAQRGISDLFRAIRRCGDKRLAIVERTLGEFFLRAHDKQLKPIDKRRLKNGLPLRVLVGSIGPDGQPVCFRYSSQWTPRFDPFYVQGVSAIGDERAASIVLNVLKRRMEERWQSGDLPVNPRDWQVDVVVAIQQALVDTGRSRSVGGTVQSVVVMKNRVEEQMFSMAEGDPMDEASWRPLTDSTARLRPQDRPIG
ncbi:MAG: hypothetical protein AB7K36_29680 [Chloroflexota bacterium]